MLRTNQIRHTIIERRGVHTGMHPRANARTHLLRHERGGGLIRATAKLILCLPQQNITANKHQPRTPVLLKTCSGWPAVGGEQRTRWGSPWGGRSSDSWHTAPRVSPSAPCSGCSSLQTSGAPSTERPAARTTLGTTDGNWIELDESTGRIQVAWGKTKQRLVWSSVFVWLGRVFGEHRKADIWFRTVAEWNMIGDIN